MKEINEAVNDYVAGSSILNKILDKRDKQKLASEIQDLINSITPSLIKAHEIECYIEDVNAFCEDHKLTLSKKEFDIVLSRLIRKFDSGYSLWDNIEMQIDYIKLKI